MNNVPGNPAEEEVDSSEGRQVESLATEHELVNSLATVQCKTFRMLLLLLEGIQLKYMELLLFKKNYY